MAIRRSALLAFACLGLAACSQENAPRTGPVPTAETPAPAAEPPPPRDSDELINIVGNVHHLDLEGGVYVIRTEDGAQYRPIELPEEFRVDGLAVEASAKRRDDVLTVDMAGQAIELLDIRKRAAD
jgi:hypothetical protein